MGRYYRPVPVRLYVALAAYAAIAVLAGFTLTGEFRVAVWVLMGGLAIKTWLGSKMQK